MKKVICFLLSVIVLWGCSPTQKAEILHIEGIQTIEYKELTEYLNSNVQFILYIGRPDCSDCQEFYPILEEYIQQNSQTGIYYLNIKAFRDQARSEQATQEEKDFYDNLYKELNFDWTPTIHVISNGKFIKTYQFLDENYIDIKDRQKQKARRQEFIDEFYLFMDDYFKEETE